MLKKHHPIVKALALLLFLHGLASHAADTQCNQQTNGEKHLYWGDLHIHTAYSMDAFVFATTQNPDAAYRFAKGEPRTLAGGEQVSLPRPLDFAAVTDHAEYFGVMSLCGAENSFIDYCKNLRAVSDGESRLGFTEFFLPELYKLRKICPDGQKNCRLAERKLWQSTIDMANAHYQPCKFTTFVANEWSASPDGLHWHRNLIYASDQVPLNALNAIDQPDKRDLWRALDQQCTADNGCDVLVIPHNSNLSMGGTFNIENSSNADMQRQSHYERLLEIHQHKGQSECYPAAGFTDEECSFEIALPTPINLKYGTGALAKLSNDEAGNVSSGYARNILAKGLKHFSASGLNPFQFGFIGSTDTHNARPGQTGELDWTGAIGGFDSTPERRNRYVSFNPGGLVAVWAENNTRESIFAALKNRQTYATSGPRIALQFSQTYSTADLCETPDAADTVMGGNLAGEKHKGENARNTGNFFVRVLMDKVPLVRVEIIKLGFGKGDVEQSIFQIENQNGRTSWCVKWQDPDFDKDAPALWYARVLEQPTARWNSGDPESGEAQVMIQERAWSSPIWSLPHQASHSIKPGTLK